MDLTLMLWPFVGGLLIGLSAILLLWFNGRIAGCSGLLWAAVNRFDINSIAFVVGLPVGAWLLHKITGMPIPEINPSWLQATIAGLIVGIGVKIGNGCTSGHGICGISRLSLRSLVATVTFMALGIITVTIARHVL